MAASIDWPTGVITVPQSDLTNVSGSLYELDTDALRLDLKAQEASSDGMAWPRTNRHNTEVTVAGVTFARTIELINGYSLTFEDTGSDYTVRLVGSNNNFFDAENGILNSTPGVTVISGNSAGLIVNETGVSGLTPTESAALELIEKLLRNRKVTDPDTGTFTVYDDDSTTVLVSGLIYEDKDETQPYRSKGLEAQDRLE